MTESSRQHRLAERMSELAMILEDEDDRPATLGAIVSAAVGMIPGVSWAGVSMLRGRTITPEAPSDQLVVELDRLQTDLGEGPCLHAIRDQHTVRVPDLSEPGQRWPRFAAAAVERGVHSMLSVQLLVRSQELGSLNLYAGEPAAITSDAEILADLFSQHASVALAGATQEHHLTTALANRDVIGQAKGILMHRDRLTGQQAFNLLVRTSQDTNLKLADVAHWLVTEAESRATRPPQ